MIGALFVFELKQWLRRLAALAVLAALLGLGAVWLYTPDPLAQLSYVSGELPLAARLLGYAGSANLTVHVLGTLYGFILPVLLVLAGFSSARRLIARPLADGRMAQRLAAPRRRSAILFTLFWLMALEMMAAAAAAFLGQAAGAFVFLSGQADFPALLRLALGLALAALPVAGVMAAVAAAASCPVSARRLGGFLGLLFLGFLMASRLMGWPQNLRFATPFALMKGQELLLGYDGLLLPLLGLPLALLFAGFGAWAFSGRDL